MKTLIFLTFAMTTSGGIASIPFVNNLNNTVDLSVSVPITPELSDKNISELRSIQKLKQDNAIPELVAEKIDSVYNPNTHLQTHHSSTIYANYSSTKSEAAVATLLIESKHKHLGNVYKSQIDLSHEKQTYDEVQSRLTTNTPNTSEWEISSKTGSTDCEIKKIPTPKTTSTSVDSCSYGWNIWTISLDDKIKGLLSDTTPPITSTLLDKFNKLVASRA